MIGGVGARLGITVVLIVLQTSLFAFELLPFISSFKSHHRQTQPQRWFLPIGTALLATILVSVTFANPDVNKAFSGTECSIGVDADIAGEGVRIAAFIQVCIAIFVSLLGSFHPKATGAKEIGAGLVLTSLSLAIALMVRMQRGTLTPVDAAISAMILDGQCMALLIQLAAKETLTSRWQVGIVVSAQFVGLGTIAAMVTNFNRQAYASTDCSCLTVFWWGWLGQCRPFSSSLEHSVFWSYFACRFVSAVQMSFHAIWNTNAFDKAEKDTRDTSDERMKLGGTLVNITLPHFSDRGRARYGEYPATVTFMYALYGVFALTSLVTAQTTIRDLRLVPSSGADSTGQVIALVVAAATVLRAAWLLVFLFWREEDKRWGFQWPFRLGQSAFYGSAPTWIQVWDCGMAPAVLPLGTLLRDPYDVFTKYGEHVSVPSDLVRSHSTRDWKYENSSSRGHGFEIAGVAWKYFVHSQEAIKADEMEEKSFLPSKDFLAKCSELHEIRDDVGRGTNTVTIYIVTAVKISTGLDVKSSMASGKLAHWSVEASGPLSVGASLGGDSRQEQDKPRSQAAAVVFSYRAREYTLTGDGRVL